jgi:hypothetical protein
MATLPREQKSSTATGPWCEPSSVPSPVSARLTPRMPCKTRGFACSSERIPSETRRKSLAGWAAPPAGKASPFASADGSKSLSATGQDPPSPDAAPESQVFDAETRLLLRLLG